MGYFNFYFLKKFLSKIFTKKMLIYIIIFLIIIIIKSNVFAATPSSVFDLERQLRDNQIFEQDTFAMHCVQPFLNKTDYWYNCLLPIFEDIDSRDKSFNITHNIQHDSDGTDYLVFNIVTFDLSESTTYTTSTVGVDGVTYNVVGRQWSNNVNVFKIKFNYADNTGTLMSWTNQSWAKQDCVARTKSEFFLNFINSIYLPDSSAILNDINNYLDNIDEVNTDILSILQTMTSSLSSIQTNTSANYSQQLNQISSKVSDLLDDNSEIISQNDEMISQQEQINDNLEQLSTDIQDVKDTITDDTVESSASDLPSTDVQNPTENGIDNIFQSIYNAFCVGSPQDIVFPIPFTNKNITLSPYYVRDMLNNNNAGWIYTLIQAFWGYLIGCYIVSDISKKIDKIKSGNIEDVQNSNIKEEML